jgi:hypothetical protein
MRRSIQPGTYDVTMPCRFEAVEGEPCEQDIVATLGDGGLVEDATFSCTHEALVLADAAMMAALQEEAISAYTDQMARLYDDHVNNEIDRRLGK